MPSVTRMCIQLIGLYQRFISRWFPRHCRFYPTCSQYAVEALEKHGLWRGLRITLFRLARCNPFNHGGYDPVK